MTPPPSKSALPERSDLPPEAVVRRLTQRLLPIRSVWFPTPRELRAWSDAGVPLYVRPLSATAFEVGPRLASMWAACFAPVWVATATARAEGSTLTWRTRWPWFTLGLMMGWWAILIGWPVALAYTPSSDEPERWLVFWAFLVVASTAGPALGWWFGGQTLFEAQPWLVQALQQPDVDEDW